MAHQLITTRGGGGGIVTQSLPQAPHQDAAQIARIWMSGVPPPARSDQQQPQPPQRELELVAPPWKQEEDGAEEPVKKAHPGGPTSAGLDRRPAAADQTQPPCAAAQAQAQAQAQAADGRNNNHDGGDDDGSAVCAADPNEQQLQQRYSQLQSPLFGQLPAELRLQVWRHALTPAADIDRPAVAVGLLETCRRAYDETKLLVYELNQIRAHLLQSPLPPSSSSTANTKTRCTTSSSPSHWTRLLSPQQQRRTHLNLYVQPGASSAWGWNLLRWTKLAGFAPATLQLTVWFASGANWWRHHVDDMVKSVRAMRGLRRCVFEVRVELARFFAEGFEERLRELRARRIVLADGSVLVSGGRGGGGEGGGDDAAPLEYREGSRVMMDNVFGRPASLREEEQPRWVPCRDPKKGAEREMLATVIRWEAA
ncbi:uncharacterized protein BKCO1_6000019 [Diplodia corticola]|uniref:Uncharacterized protein n=1 Tax=Diplodia corticola TaxID=236234 RepID=A0A1J9QQZ6_9PEZI|nr:uncharacterized protein BKCO1_6000019 [Diplodia corticola]OJD30442.1 hypothetical protein BKCO1_6000019 [Diplodia corticola]